MKHKILILIALCLQCQGSFCQTEIAKDSSYLINNSGIFYRARFTENDRGEQVTVTTLIGSAEKVSSEAKARFLRESERMASDAQLSRLFQKRLKEIKRENDALKSSIGISPLDSIQRESISDLTANGWTINENGTVRDVVFSVNASGQLRYKISTDAAKNAVFFGGAIRLNNYPSNGKDLDFYLLQNKNFGDLTGAITIRRPGSNANIKINKRKN